MEISSIHLLQYRLLLPIHPSASPITRTSTSRFSPLSAKNNTHDVYRNFEKKLLKKREGIKEHSSLAPLPSSPDELVLSPNQAIGLVVASHSNFMRVVVPTAQADGNLSPDNISMINVELLCVVKAVLKKIGRRVMVGDKVVVGSIDWEARRGMIENILARKSEIFDPPVANVSHLLVLFSMEQPKIEPVSLTRFLVEAESTGVPLTLALNKSELVEETALSSWKDKLQKWGYKAVFCSVKIGCGIEELKFVLKEQTTVVVGPSGVGKSSVINLLRSNEDGSDINWFDPIEGSTWFEDQRVGEVSSRTGRGKHTTRNVSLLPLNQGGYLADTPGFSMPELLKVTTQSLAEAFPEIRWMIHASEAGMCMFNDCLHLGEQGCAVNTDWERYPYYLKLLDEIKVREKLKFRTQGTKKEPDVRYKIGSLGVKQAEPRLDSKYRRESRKKRKQDLFNKLDVE